MKAILSNTHPKSKRLKIAIPYAAIEWRAKIKTIRGVWYHKPQKLWSVPNTPENMQTIRAIFGEGLEIKEAEETTKAPRFEATPRVAMLLESMQVKLILSGMSAHTIKAYRANVCHFFDHFQHRDIGQLTKAEIEMYMYDMKKKYGMGEAKQNMIINAIKFYLEKVLGLERTVYDLTRPKSSQTLPDTLCEADTYTLINTPTNIKHRCILHLLYSSGLRRGEIPKLRIEDINSVAMNVFVKGAKGKKDRYTVLSTQTLQLLREYVRKYRPSYWLFEGSDGGQYSVSSVNKVFRKAAKLSGIAAWATPHTLRHSFATHLLQANVNLRYIQACLGHESPETTQIYTHIANINNSVVKSPLDRYIEQQKTRNT